MPRAEIASKQAIFTLFPASFRTGGEVRGEPGRWHQNQNGHDAGRGCPADAKAGLQYQGAIGEEPQQEQPLVQARYAVPERGRRHAAGASPNDGAGDRRSPDSRKGPAGHTQASYRPTGGYLGRAAEAQWRGGYWRGGTRAMALERGQLRGAYGRSKRSEVSPR